jgi:hypothetical protein
MHTSSCLPIVLNSLKSELTSLSHRLSAHATGLPLLPALGADSYLELPSLSHIDNCLCLFDSFLLGRWEEDDSVNRETLLDSAKEGGLGATLVQLCVVVDVVSRDDESPHYTVVGSCYFVDLLPIYLLCSRPQMLRICVSGADQPHAR